MAVGETGDVYVWGRAKEGQLGNGERKAANALKPVRVEGLRHERVVAGVCGYNHCLAVTVGGKLYQWGMLHKHVEGSANKEYFGMAIGLSGLNSDRMKRMVGRSHSTYYAGAFFFAFFVFFIIFIMASYICVSCRVVSCVRVRWVQRVRRVRSWRSCRACRTSVRSRPTRSPAPKWSPASSTSGWSRWRPATRSRWRSRRRARSTRGASTRSASWASAIATTRVRRRALCCVSCVSCRVCGLDRTAELT
jgi:hypothetical protein